MNTYNDPNAEQKISQKFAACIAAGMTVREAWAVVFPSIPFEQFAGELWEALRA